MSFLRLSLACLIATAGATGSFAQDTAPAAPAATVTPDAKPAKVHKICHQDVDTGSIMPHTTCHTKDEWAAIAAQNQQQVEQNALHHGGGASGH